MVIADIERRTPSLLGSPGVRTNRTSSNKALERRPSRRSAVRKPTIRPVKTPWEMYEDSCRRLGYEPETVRKAAVRNRMVVKPDGSQWHPHTLEKITAFLESEGESKLSVSLRRVVAVKVKQGSTCAAEMQSAISCLDKRLNQ